MKPRNLQPYLEVAGVPPHLHPQALECLALAEQRARGLLAHKLKVRLLRAPRIARAMPWDAERLLDVRPEWADDDIAPMRNITGHGDNIPWGHDGPITGAWLHPDTDAQARQACYWCEGEHPRSRKARAAWYRRNGGEYRAWRLGQEVDTARPLEQWVGEQGRLTVRALHLDGVWLVISQRRCGPVTLHGRHGFEIDNAMGWVPLPGHALRAPVAWSTVPRLSAKTGAL